MRILHLGGYGPLTDALAAQQAALGHDVLSLAVSARNSILHIPCALDELADRTGQLASQHFDIIQFHRFESLSYSGRSTCLAVRTMLSSLKATGARLVLYTYGNDLLTDGESRRACGLTNDLFKEFFDHIFIGTAGQTDLNGLISSWSWLSPGLDFRELPATRPEEPVPQRLRILHIPYRVKPAETRLIVETLAAIAQGKNLFNLEILPPELISSKSDLTSALMRCDLFIEQLQRPSYGFLAIEALAHGRTVLSGNARAAQQQWDQLMTCPVLDTNGGNFKSRIESILREPRCLRDLGKRSRQYSEKHHSATVTSRVMLGTYESILAATKAK